MFNFATEFYCEKRNKKRMTFEEIAKIPDLQIEVTPAVEDAFYFLRHIENQKPIKEVLAMSDQQEKDYDLFCQASQHAGVRLLKVSREERMEAILRWVSKSGNLINCFSSKPLVICIITLPLVSPIHFGV